MAKNAFAEFSTTVDVFDVEVSAITTDVPSGVKVPNRFPSLTNYPYRIAIIGEAPGKDEELQGIPFVGMSGKLLNGMLAKAGITCEACFVGNICQTRPANNDINNATASALAEGVAQLADDLDKFKPNICLLLGRTPLEYFAGTTKIGDFRGSLGMGKMPFPYKYVPSYHPAAVLRQFEWSAYLWFDIVKCKNESFTPNLTLPDRLLEVSLSYDELIARLEDLVQNPRLISVDLEGYWNNLSCCSIADSASNSFIVPFANLDSSHYWSEEQEVEVWRHFAAVMTDVRIEKVFQNGLYDRFVLQYGFNITVRGNVDDTMLKWAEKWCELEKGLGVQASILTNEPYYKFERKSTTKEDYYRYCCKDSAVTYELNTKLSPMLDEAQLNHYSLNVALLNPILYMELRGIKYDTKEAHHRLEEISTQIYCYQARLDKIAGVGVLGSISRPDLVKRIAEACCYKRDPSTFKAAFTEYEAKLRTICQGTLPLTEEEIGFVNIACGWSMNIKSDKFKTFLYGTLKLPKQYDPKTKSLTTDYEALLKISKKQPHEAVTLALELGELRTRSQMLGIHADPDGRIRCGYNIVGTETGRITCYTSPTGSGYNLQTIPDTNALKEEGHPLRQGLRHLFVADPGYYLYQCDLSGADGWTVGAHLASLGDPTMLDDLRYGIKPAQRICYMLRHGNDSLKGKDRAEVKELLKTISKDSWDYFACKGGIWGTCYTMGPRKLSDHIFVQSEGKVIFSEGDAKMFQQAVFQVYNVHLWHRWMERHLAKKPELVSPNGHRRRFFGRSTEILGKALAHEPQVNTTYATNLAAWRLWTDATNRTNQNNNLLGGHSRVALKIEPLHQVHDALIVQAPIPDTDWCISKLKSYFCNEIIIAGIPVTIPFGGSYGPSWGEQTFSIK